MRSIRYNESSSKPGRSWTRLVDMGLSDEEKSEGGSEPMDMPDRPRYPYGLRICLTEAELVKLGLDDSCEIGDLLDMRCFCQVTSVSKNITEDGSHSRVELQIISIAAENELLETMG